MTAEGGHGQQVFAMTAGYMLTKMRGRAGAE